VVTPPQSAAALPAVRGDTAEESQANGNQRHGASPLPDDGQRFRLPTRLQNIVETPFMRHPIYRFPLLLLVVFTAFGLNQPAMAQQQLMSPELLWKLGRLGESIVSPDGKTLAWTVRTYVLAENSGTSALVLSDADGGNARNALVGWKQLADLHWGKFADQQVIFFTGVKPKSDEPAAGDSAEGNPLDESPQIYRLDPASGETTRITNVDDGVSNVKFAPNGHHAAFTIDVKLDQTVNDLYADLPKADARIIDSLMYRHWNAWHDYKYSHLHVAAIGKDGMAGEAHDLMAGMRVDCPVPPFGGSEQFAWSPDGKQLCYTAKISDHWAESTDSDLYLISVNEDGSAAGEAVCITEGRDGYDNNPAWSPDGKYIAFNSMVRPGFEADRNRIMLYQCRDGQISELTADLDQNANHFHWLADSSGVIFVSEYRGSDQLFQMDLGAKTPRQISEGWADWDIVDEIPGSNQLLVTRTSMIRPAELHSLSLQDKSDKKLSAINDEIYATLALPSIRERWVETTDGKQMQCWVIYPPGFDESKQYPMLTYCQGGPQGQVSQFFSYRWNFHLMAANGYVIVAPNRRGLPGFGRAWNDEISGDWGGQAMKDILSATDSMLAEPYINKKKVAAVGASFGGYTVYWLMGNHKGRFATMIAHCGVFNLESMYGATEELFFVNWDLGGPYWKSPELQKKYDQFSPHRFVQNWDTPLMVIHGEKDFRVPVTQGMEAFTAAQTRGIESRFLYFPDEGHWVMSPQNGVLWHRLFFDWLDRFCK
jgi:dipeptidyl aminopeptidase/acylaminoacyl peptidase